jgi:hypothetical protein
MFKGPFVALGAVGLTTAILAAIVAALAAVRSHRPSLKRPLGYVASAASTAGESHSAPPYPLFSAGSTASFVDAFGHNLTHRTAAATNDALDSAAEIARKSPREAILATLGVAVVVGLFIGRRR